VPQRFALFMLLAFLVPPTLLSAGQFQKSQVAAKARWVIHSDVTRLVGTDMGRYLLSQVDGLQGGSRLAVLQALANFDLQRDLSSLTVYGTNAIIEQGVTILEGTFDQARIVAGAQRGEAYLEFRHQGHAVHSWMPRSGASDRGDDGTAAAVKRLFACFAGPRLLLVSQSYDAVKTGLDVLDGRAPALEASPLADAMKPSTASSFLTAVGDLPPARGAAQHPLLRQTRRVSLDLGEAGSITEGQLVLLTDNLQAAGQMFVILQGMIASAVLQQDQRPELARFARALRPKVEGNKLRVSVRHSSQDCLAILKNWRTYLQMLPQSQPQPPGKR